MSNYKSAFLDQNQFKEPSSLFEHFFVVGLHSYANVAVIEDAFAKNKAWKSNVACSEVVDLSKIQYHGPIPTMEPQNKQTKSPVQTVPQGIKRHPRSTRPQRLASFLPPPGEWSFVQQDSERGCFSAASVKCLL